MPGEPLSLTDTSFASPLRADVTTLQEQREAFRSDPVALALLEAMPGPAMVLNRQRQVVALNRPLREMFGVADERTVVGLRPGELIRCVHSDEREAGCGTTRACAHCGAVNAILDCITNSKRTSREARIRTRSGASLDARLHASPVTVGGVAFVVLALEDIGHEKRRQVLERLFLRDLHATCDDMRGIAARIDRAVPDAEADRADRRGLHRLADLALDQLEGQRQLLAAETGDLAVEPRATDLAALLEDLAEGYRRLPSAQGRFIRLEHGRASALRTDPELLARAMGDLVRNALEATPAGGTVSVSCEVDRHVATLSVHNDGVIPEDVQLQIFQRSFTTRAGDGRGVGTYRAKLIVERYLGGSVEFVSDERVGTLFVVMVPEAAPVASAA